MGVAVVLVWKEDTLAAISGHVWKEDTLAVISGQYTKLERVWPDSK